MKFRDTLRFLNGSDLLLWAVVAMIIFLTACTPQVVSDRGTTSFQARMPINGEMIYNFDQ